jgi:O-succinylbenzoate synthase
MKIDAITINEIGMPLVHFFETSFGRTTDRRILLVAVHTGGVTGWGECTAGEHPNFSHESVDTAWQVIRTYLAPALLGNSVDSGRDVPKHFRLVRGHPMAKAVVENAVWDAEAQLKNVPLWKLVGGTRRELECGVSIGIQNTPEHLMDKIATELAAGYRRIKVKVKPGWDTEILERIRSRWPQIVLSCDANSAYTLDDLPHLRSFDRFKLLMIEQPLWSDDFYFHARLQKEVQTAICLDEAIRNARDAEAAIEVGACRIINIKLGRVGGFSEAIRVHDVCRVRNVANWCGGMLESGIGRAHNIAMSTLENFRLPGDVSASRRYWAEDIIEPEVTVSKDGLIAVPQGPGRGFRVREERIERLTVRKETFRAGATA